MLNMNPLSEVCVTNIFSLLFVFWFYLLLLLPYNYTLSFKYSNIAILPLQCLGFLDKKKKFSLLLLDFTKVFQKLLHFINFILTFLF